ncbi:PilN domain-containing protein [Desulfoluna sp.]|uniref:PilN domain-containing protein n=1 Tax=Desulfoluna sp. TaxID=2045199 RepID=UPI0026295304|nr:PilN domain-containing protein [Desulfoluna sp.]
MIRINLLPFRDARTKENVRRQVTIFLLLILLIVVGMGGFSLSVSAKVDEYRQKVSDTQAELNKFKKKAKEVDAINKKNKMLQKKIDIIETLQVVRKTPVRVLGAMTELVIPDRMWIRNYDEVGNNVTLKGAALDEITVADFTRKLEMSEYFSSASLRFLKRGASEKNVPMKNFEIVCTRAKLKQKSTNATGMKVK